MFKFYVGNQNQYVIYDKEKDYGWFFDEWSVYDYIEEIGYKLGREINLNLFMMKFHEYLKDYSPNPERQLIKAIL